MDMQKNEGINITGGNINVEQMTAGSHSQNIQITSQDLESDEDQINSSAILSSHMKLYKQLDAYFGEEDIKSLCFELEIDYDNLPALGKSNKIRELIILVARNNSVDQLIGVCQTSRPKINWDQL